jgi:glycosyltransferase involved in cell wall biosynthesis
MKVLIATPLYPPEPGGPATYVKLLEESLPKKGVEVSVLAFGAVRRLPKGIRHMTYFFSVWRASRGVDVVYALDTVSVGLPAMLAAALWRKPFVVKVVGDYAWEQGKQRFGVTEDLDQFVLRRKLPSALQRLRDVQMLVMRRAVQIIVPSAYLKHILELSGVAGANIVVIHNAVRPEAPVGIPETIQRAVQETQPIVSIGRLVPWKGFSELIRAVAQLHARGIQTPLVIVGDGPERHRLEREANQLLPSGSFIFTGALPHAQTYAVLHAARVFVLDSSYEGLSHTLVEALFAGSAIIASDIAGNREVIRHEENGLLVDPGNADALAGVLKRLLEDDVLRSSLALRARESSFAFTVDTMIDRVAAALRAVASR